MAIAMFRSRVHLSIVDYTSLYLIAIAMVWRLNYRLYERFGSRYRRPVRLDGVEHAEPGPGAALSAGEP
jgi:hypothetical protein